MNNPFPGLKRAFVICSSSAGSGHCSAPRSLNRKGSAVSMRERHLSSRQGFT